MDRRHWLLALIVLLLVLVLGLATGPCVAPAPVTDEPAGSTDAADAPRPRRRRERTQPEAPTEPETAEKTGTTATTTVTVGGGAPQPEPPQARDTTPEPGADPETGELRVIVTDGAGGFREGAHLLVYGKNGEGFGRTHRVPTDASGQAEARGLEPGSKTITIELGDLRRMLRVTVVAGQVTEKVVEIPAGATVEGVVRHVHKGPLEGIEVAAGALIRIRGDEPFNRFSTRTDARGRYRLENVPVGTHAISLRGEAIGYHPRPRGTLVVPSAEDVTHDFVLGEVALAGVVLDAKTRAPIAGAAVQIQDPLYASATTDARGVYRFLDLPAGDYPMVVTHDGHGRLFLQSGPVEEGRPRNLDIELRPAATLRIAVTDGDGRPTAGSFVLAVSPLGDDTESRGSSGVTVAEDGSATYSRLVPGSYELRLTGDGFEPDTVTLDVAMGETDVAFRMVRKTERKPGHVVVRGTVRDARTGETIPGVRVTIGGSSPPQWLTDANGRYELTSRWHGRQRLSMSRDGYGFRFLEPVAIDPDTERTIDAKLEPAATVRLRVRGPTGDPVVGHLTLSMHPQVEGTGTRLATGVEADSDGVVVYRQMLPAKYLLRVFKDGVGRASVETEVFPGENEVEFDLE